MFILTATTILSHYTHITWVTVKSHYGGGAWSRSNVVPMLRLMCAAASNSPRVSEETKERGIQPKEGDMK